MGFNNRNGKPVLLAMIKAVQDNKDYLSEVDGLIGDGDHGMNMNKGFSLFADEIAGKDIGFTEGLNGLGSLLFAKIGGSMGPIYGNIFMQMSEAGSGKETLETADLAAMFRAGLDALYDIVDARVGDKTLVDTLAPACDALAGAAKRGADLKTALEEMKAAAVRGWESTKDLAAKFGRSSRLGERSRGVYDAGATSCRIILEAMAEGIIAQAEK
jgi:dihydroxyacetone kinase-like protein